MLEPAVDIRLVYDEPKDLKEILKFMKILILLWLKLIIILVCELNESCAYTQFCKYNKKNLFFNF